MPCGSCGGSGKVVLSGVYSATLRLLRSQTKPINGAALAKLAGCSGMSMCNRLSALERHGVAVGERDGRQRLWKAARNEV